MLDQSKPWLYSRISLPLPPETYFSSPITCGHRQGKKSSKRKLLMVLTMSAIKKTTWCPCTLDVSLTWNQGLFSFEMLSKLHPINEMRKTSYFYPLKYLVPKKSYLKIPKNQHNKLWKIQITLWERSHNIRILILLCWQWSCNERICLLCLYRVHKSGGSTISKFYDSRALPKLSKIYLRRGMPYNYLKHKLLASHWAH